MVPYILIWIHLLGMHCRGQKINPEVKPSDGGHTCSLVHSGPPCSCGSHECIQTQTYFTDSLPGSVKRHFVSAGAALLLNIAHLVFCCLILFGSYFNLEVPWRAGYYNLWTEEPYISSLILAAVSPVCINRLR